MNKPITNKLQELLNNDTISMHVPGHKNMTIGKRYIERTFLYKRRV
ncbi:hypothetical protein ACN9US_12595 [Staphylococcus caprae]